MGEFFARSHHDVVLFGITAAEHGATHQAHQCGDLRGTIPRVWGKSSAQGQDVVRQNDALDPENPDAAGARCLAGE
ncbi:hypothetical protein ACFU8Q_30300 [Streptomyces sp. NPDC057543]|uniref:hypothetical protein n=1 Tax=Streptomyces sp. NPDC057543 TaxID=3346163 RepID=UPI0036BA9100